MASKTGSVDPIDLTTWHSCARTMDLQDRVPLLTPSLSFSFTFAQQPTNEFVSSHTSALGATVNMQSDPPVCSVFGLFSTRTAVLPETSVSSAAGYLPFQMNEPEEHFHLFCWTCARCH